MAQTKKLQYFKNCSYKLFVNLESIIVFFVDVICPVARVRVIDLLNYKNDGNSFGLISQTFVSKLKEAK